jgi:threonine dehydrogenase-like Zn-dependent dehydrogenase
VRAAVYRGPGEIRVEDVPEPEPGPRDVLLRVEAVGICGSDLHVYRLGQYNAEPGRIMGHEFSAVAVEVGAEVEGVESGGRYTGFSIAYCGECWWCRAGKPRMCPHLFENYSGYGRPGAMAEYMLIKDAKLGENLFPIDPGLSEEIGAMAEPLGTAVYSVIRTKPGDGETVLVLGAGMIGNLVVQTLKARADVRVVVSEISAGRRELALECGADAVVDAAREDLFDAVVAEVGRGRSYFGESGMADLVIDAAAAPPTFGQALEFVRALGTVGLVGSPEKPAPVPVGLIGEKDLRVVGIIGSVIPAALDLLAAGAVRTEPLISHRFGLEDAAEAFAVAAGPDSMKVLMFPQGN